MQRQQGFTLIELIMVIVILGILAAVAIPRFIDLSAEARQAAVEGVAGALGAASAINYAAFHAGSPDVISVDDCNQIGQLLEGGALPDGYSIEDQSLPANDSAECTVVDQEDTAHTATFTGHGVDS